MIRKLHPTPISPLHYCAAAQIMGMTTPLLLQVLRTGGRSRLKLEELRQELGALEQKGLLQRNPQSHQSAHEIWQVTLEGRKHLAAKVTRAK